ncbi:MAG: 16S rRNA (uracil(1498)-N(3))-methyltransferase [Pyrinomonadaceae bacterium]
MTRRRFYTSPESFTPQRSSFSLDEDESRHLREVLRLRPGDQVYVFDGEGREFLCEVETVERRGAAVLKVRAEVEAARPESKLELTLALALLKGEKFDLVVQKATELGVMRIAPVITKRADVRLREERDASKKRTARLRRLALEAAKQSGRARIPKIEQPVLFAELMERGRDNGPIVLFAERDGDNLGEWKLAAGEGHTKLTALVGPEGGWEDAEIAYARAAGCQVVTLGGRILRAETAAIAVVVLLQHLFGDLN